MPELGSLFKDVFKRAVGATAAVFDYGNPEDFSRLWEHGAPTVLTDVNGKQAIVIVWDGRSQDESDSTEKLLTPHLTPLDWALAFSIKALGAESPPSLRIHIVDLTGKKHDEWAMRMRHQLLAEMPWVRLYAPLVPAGENGKPARYRRCYENIVDLIPELPTMPTDVLTMADSIKGQEEPVKQALSLIANAWRASLIQSDDHHDLNNLIGATVASGGDDNSPLIRAFCKRLEFSGHLSQSYLTERNKAVDGVIDVVNADILVIDDMLSMGWDRYLCKALSAEHEKEVSFEQDKFVQFGTRGELKLHGCLSAAALIDSWKIKPPRLDQRSFSHRFLLGSDKTTYGEILILDLRLGDTQKIKSQVTALLGIFGDSLTNTQLLAWDVIDQDEQERIRKWCKKLDASEDTDGFVDAITLMPRVCALINPLTPVILFSSTARADIKQKLSSYRNIYCGFEKPQVLQQPESVLQSILGLRYQLRDCKKLIAFRRSLAFVEGQAEIARQARGELTAGLQGMQSVECYFDESSKDPLGNNLISGAFVLLAKTDLVSLSINQLLSTTDLKHTKYAVGGDMEREKKRDEVRDSVSNIFTSKSGEYRSIGVGFNISDSVINSFANDLFSSTHPECKLDYLLRFTIDFCGVVLPWFLGFACKETKFCFDVRSLPADTQKQREERWLRFGLEENKNVLMNKSYNEGSYYPLIRESMLRWPNSWWKLIPHTVRGYQLSKQQAARPSHYLADWVNGAMRDAGKGIRFIARIVDAKDIYKALATLNKFWLLESFRLATHGENEEAIVHLLLHSGISPEKVREAKLDEPDNPMIEQVLLLGIYEHALQMARGDALFQALSADKSSRKSGVQSSGISEQYDDGFENSTSRDEVIDEAEQPAGNTHHTAPAAVRARTKAPDSAFTGWSVTLMIKQEQEYADLGENELYGKILNDLGATLKNIPRPTTSTNSNGKPKAIFKFGYDEKDATKFKELCAEKTDSFWREVFLNNPIKPSR